MQHYPESQVRTCIMVVGVVETHEKMVFAPKNPLPQPFSHGPDETISFPSEKRNGIWKLRHLGCSSLSTFSKGFGQSSSLK